MCGIVGYIGSQKASPILMNGLLKLEYRGYDSAGISTMESTGISNLKDKGRVANLQHLEGIDSLTGTIGIAHTRWATHGKPSKENSHPHMDNANQFSVVHNGIIENYQELRNFLMEEGYTFLSQTDTEVIPNLIHYYYTHEENQPAQKKFIHSVHMALKRVKGSYAIEVLCKDYPDTMIVARKNNPLVIGVGKDENYISSDIPAILSYTKNFYLLNDGDLAELYRDHIVFYNEDLQEIQKEIKSVDWDATAAEKDGYEDYMLKEIHEQPRSVRETIGCHLKLNDKVTFPEMDLSKDFLSQVNHIYIVACGSAMYTGLVAKPIFEKLCNVPVSVDIASEFRYRNPILNSHTLCLYISQSGETADTIAALKLAKSKGAKTLAITNVIGSSITREADFTVYTHAGPEIAVATTKAYTSQIALLSILAIHFAELLDYKDEAVLNSLKSALLALPEKIEEVLNASKSIKDFAHEVYQERDIFFIGRGTDYATTVEGALKLKEISYIHSEAYAAGELKHGPIALIENDITVVGIMTDPNLVEKTVSNIQEVIARGAKTLIITNQALEVTNYTKVISIPETDPMISPILSIIPLQLFSYYISKEKGLDVDKPRNLAKSVTVE